MSELKRYDVYLDWFDGLKRSVEPDGQYYLCSDVDPMRGEIAALKELMLEAADHLDYTSEVESGAKLSDKLREAAK